MGNNGFGTEVLSGVRRGRVAPPTGATRPAHRGTAAATAGAGGPGTGAGGAGAAAGGGAGAAVVGVGAGLGTGLGAGCPAAADTGTDGVGSTGPDATGNPYTVSVPATLEVTTARVPDTPIGVTPEPVGVSRPSAVTMYRSEFRVP